MIRHGRTKGNLEKRYVGTTDEGMLSDEVIYIKTHTSAYRPVMHVYCSPMKRCMETAAFIYPQIAHTICPDFRECDFGVFEYHNYIELEGDTEYQAWIDSNGTIPFPGGERIEIFKKRCIQEFRWVLADACEMRYDAIACVVHGGTIMAIMEAFASPFRAYYDWQADNLSGYDTKICMNHGGEIMMTSYEKIVREL